MSKKKKMTITNSKINIVAKQKQKRSKGEKILGFFHMFFK